MNTTQRYNWSQERANELLEEADNKIDALEADKAKLRQALKETTDRYELLERLYFSAVGENESPETNGTIQRNRSLLKTEEDDANIPEDFGTHQYHDIG